MCIYTTYVILLLFLGLSRFIARGSGALRLLSVAVSLSLADLARHCLAAAPTGPPLKPLLLLLLVFLICRLGNLDYDRTAIEFLLVKELDCLFRGFSGGNGDKTVAS